MSAYIHLIRVSLFALALLERLRYNLGMHSHTVCLCRILSFGGKFYSPIQKLKEARLTIPCFAFGLTIKYNTQSLVTERLESACENIGRPRQSPDTALFLGVLPWPCYNDNAEVVGYNAGRKAVFHPVASADN